MFDKARAHSRKKQPSPRREEYPLLDLSGFNKLIQSGSNSLHKIGSKARPILHETRERIGDAYSSFAQVWGQQKENLEDYLAEKRHQSRQTVKSLNQHS